jgi:LPS export ABC transporter protein LptC
MDAQEMEIRRFRHVFVRSLWGLVLVGLAGAPGCNREDSAVPVETASKPLPDQVISDFSITETAKGRREWKMEAGRALVYERRNLLEADTVRVTFFDGEGGVRSVLTARHGKLNRNTDDMEARGDVVVTGSDGVVLRTESLTWIAETHQIVSQDSVTVIRHGDVLTGWGFKGDPDLGKFEILRNMRATIRPARMGTGGAGS